MTDLRQQTFNEIRRARRTDPDTSRESARQSHGLASEHRQKLLAALRSAKGAMGCPDMSATEIAYWTGLSVVQVCRRLKELADDGEIRATANTRPTASGRPSQCWEVCA